MTILLLILLMMELQFIRYSLLGSMKKVGWNGLKFERARVVSRVKVGVSFRCFMFNFLLSLSPLLFLALSPSLFCISSAL